MKKLLLLLLFIPLNVFGLEIHSDNALLYNMNDNTVLFEKESEEVIKIASMTKIMTTIIAIENIENLDEKVTLTSNMFYGLVEANASVAGFKVGDLVTYRDLLYGTMLPSGADATQALAILISGSEENFVKLMNDKVIELGLMNTNFVNTSGLDAELHYSTVTEVAAMLKYALKNDTFKEIFESKEYIATNGLKMRSTLVSYQLKFNVEIDKIEGGKTGYTDLAGYCLASISSYNGVSYMLITANAYSEEYEPLHIYDTYEIYDYYFDNYGYKDVLIKGKKITDLVYEDQVIPVVNEVEKTLYLENGTLIIQQ